MVDRNDDDRGFYLIIGYIIVWCVKCTDDRMESE